MTYVTVVECVVGCATRVVLEDEACAPRVGKLERYGREGRMSMSVLPYRIECEMSSVHCQTRRYRYPRPALTAVTLLLQMGSRRDSIASEFRGE